MRRSPWAGALGAGAVAVSLAGANEAGQAQRMPEVRVLEDGTLVQRVPSVSSPVARDDASYVMAMPNYNAYFLQAEARGCGACHDDLGKVIDESAYGFYVRSVSESGQVTSGGPVQKMIVAKAEVPVAE